MAEDQKQVNEKTAEESRSGAQQGNTNVNPAPPVKPFPNKKRYEDGYVFNQQLAFWQKYSDEELKGLGLTESDITLVHEALAFHKLEAGALREDRIAHEEAVKSEGKAKTAGE